MKKPKLVIAITIMAIIGMLTACTVSKDAGKAEIKPSKFSAETEKVLKILDDDILFFDYTATDQMKSYLISVWVYEGGTWINKGDSSGNIEKAENQIALRVRETGYELWTIDESGHVKYSSPEPAANFEDMKQETTNQLNTETEITLNREIPLFVKIGSNESQMTVTDDFRLAKCNAGIAVTVTFSEQPLT